LTDRSREAWFTAPIAALDLAGLAVGIARSLDTSRYGRNLVEDARARAWAYLGNAYRILADLPRAEAALGQARRHLELSGDLLVRGEVLRFLGSLQNSRDRFDEAIHCLDEAVEIYRELGDRRLEAWILLSQGKNLGDAGRFGEAIRVLSQALSGIRSEEEPRLWVMLRHNLLMTMSDLGKHEAALKALQRSEWAYREAGGSVLLRGRWAEAILSYRLGSLNAAESLLLEVRDAFAGLGTMAEAAQVSLKLALVYARQGRCAECKQTVSEAIPLFDSLGFRADAFASRLLYERAGRG
jgi:tetratricopeptide (TPR) repeat protein